MQVLLLSRNFDDLQGLRERIAAERRISHLQQRPYVEGSLAQIDLHDVDLLILDQPPLDARGLADLERLCRANPRVIVMMIARDGNTEKIVDVVSAGVRELLPWPAAPAQIDHALEQCLEKIDSLGATRSGRAIVVIPGKGGSGATFLATNLACACALQLERRTLIIDCDLQYGDASFALSKEPKGSHVIAALQDDSIDSAFLESACTPLRRNLSLLASPFTVRGTADFDIASVKRLLSIATRVFDVVLIDLPPQVDGLSAATMIEVSRILQVVNPTVEALRNQQRQRQYLHDLGVPLAKISVVINKNVAKGITGGSRESFAEDIEQRMETEVLATIPFDGDTAMLALASGESVVETRPSEPISRAVSALARKICDIEDDHQGLRERFAAWRRSTWSAR